MELKTIGPPQAKGGKEWEIVRFSAFKTHFFVIKLNGIVSLTVGLYENSIDFKRKS